MITSSVVFYNEYGSIVHSYFWFELLKDFESFEHLELIRTNR